MERNIEDDVRLIEAYIHGEQGKQQGDEPEEEVYHIYDVPGGIVILREGEEAFAQNATVIDSEPPEAQPQTTTPATAFPEQTLLPMQLQVTISMYLFLIFSCILFQVYVLFHPLLVTITLAAKSQQVSLTGTLQLGRVLNPITLSQSQTSPTTGHGHQDARNAIGYITFYNASFSSQTVTAGTVLTGADGVQVVTDETVTVPPNNPPQDGQASIAAHALNAGSAGNIPALDINGTVSSTLYVKNLTAFIGGQDERDFRTVTQSDIDNTASPLKTTLSQSVQGALQGQLKSGEALTALPCTPTVSSDHRAGQEATQVKVTVSLTCSALAYNGQALQAKVTQLLTSQAEKKLGSGYSLLGDVQVTINQATATHTPPLVFLAFSAQGTWVYALSGKEQEHVKNIIAGKNKQQALQLLRALPGIESASLQFSGFGDESRL